MPYNKYEMVRSWKAQIIIIKNSLSDPLDTYQMTTTTKNFKQVSIRRNVPFT